MKPPLFYQTISTEMKEVLASLMQKPYLTDFHLVGGTALSLMRGHRQSVDIDLFNINRFDVDSIKENLERDFEEFEPLRSSSLGLSCIINSIKTDIYFWNESLLNPIEEIDGIRFVSDDDIFAMKLEAIISRREKKDYIDLAELLSEYTLEWGINCHAKKFKNKDKSLVMNALSCMEEAYDTFMPVMLKPLTWNEAQTNIQQAVQEFLWLEKQRIKNKRLRT